MQLLMVYNIHICLLCICTEGVSAMTQWVLCETAVTAVLILIAKMTIEQLTTVL